MNQNVPFVWRKNYQNELASPEKVLEYAHKAATQYLSHAVEINKSSGNAKYVQIVSLITRAIGGLFKRCQKHVVVSRFSGYRWCDSTERELNEELMGRRSWIR
ncbi:MAG TPA: hypothetical protein VHT68_22300 [Pseudolabrys sp.]|jgi:hypothetical protein|nr:hypothetical protein [Pseudolabrys sp.]